MLPFTNQILRGVYSFTLFRTGSEHSEGLRMTKRISNVE